MEPGFVVEAIQADVMEALDKLSERKQVFDLVVADPPYGNIVNQEWDRIPADVEHAVWMVKVCKRLEPLCLPGASLYWWGGIGKPNCRPFFRFLLDVEEKTDWRMAALITWKKKRAYGVRNNYLFTREECAFLVLGDSKRPKTFNVPYLDKERGYPGYDKAHPALDSRLRRTMVWDDVTEVLRGKQHECEKPKRLASIMVETSSNPGDMVLDLFCGCGNVTAEACRLGRKAVAVDMELPAWLKAAQNG